MLWAACLGCKKEDQNSPMEPAQTIASYTAKSAVTVSGKALDITVLEVVDSRCPINADCVSAGAAQLKFGISDGTNSVTVSLSFVNAEKDKTVQTFKLNGQAYALKVSEVNPYPQLPNNVKLEEYKINMSIEKI